MSRLCRRWWRRRHGHAPKRTPMQAGTSRGGICHVRGIHNGMQSCKRAGDGWHTTTTEGLQGLEYTPRQGCAGRARRVASLPGKLGDCASEVLPVLRPRLIGHRGLTHWRLAHGLKWGRGFPSSAVFQSSWVKPAPDACQPKNKASKARFP